VNARRADKSPAAIRKLKAGLRRELCKFPATQVDAFIRSVGAALGRAEIHSEFPSEAARRKRLKQVKAAGARYLARLEDPGAPFPWPVDMNLNRPVGAGGRLYELSTHEFWRARQAARNATHGFNRAIDRAMPTVWQRGRPAGDPAGLAVYLAQRFEQCFGKPPTSTRTGAFFRVYQLAYKNLTGDVLVDPQKLVRAAVRSLKQPTKLPKK